MYLTIKQMPNIIDDGKEEIIMCKVKETREKINMSISKLSKKSKVSRATISKIENTDDYVTTTKTLEALANVLNCDISDIYCP
jgi:DNA-binding XRE family transcriptional regulator